MASVSTTVTANWTVVQDANGSPTVVSGDDITVYVNNSTPFFSGEAWSDVDLLAGLPSGVTITNVTFSLDVQTTGARQFSGVPMGPEIEFIDKTAYLADSWSSVYATFARGGPGDIPDDNDPHSIVYDNSVYPAQSGGAGVNDMDAFAAALVAGTVICRVQGPNGGATGTGITYQAPLTVTFFYDSGDLPCDTDVALDLAAAQFMGSSSGGPFGEFGDGVIFGGGGGGTGYPDFFFDSFTLDPTKRYRVTITFDPASGHDSGGRRFWLSAAPVGSEESVETLPGFPVGNLYDAGPSGQFRDGSAENTADSVTVTIGPGRNGWDDGTYGVAAGYARLWFETDKDGAVSAISVRKVCKTVAPPLRLTGRTDMFASARRLNSSRSQQGSAPTRLNGNL